MENNDLPTLVVINGPNLNLLGTREPETYGSTTLSEIESSVKKHAEKHGFRIKFHQSNQEGQLVDLIQDARKSSKGVILNAAAYTHTSIAIRDAVSAIDIPVIEVHLSNIFAREEYRHHSYISDVAQGVICGFGAQGYLLAVDAMANLLQRHT